MWVRVAFVILLLLVSSALRAQDGARLALVIGNQGYSGKVGPLRNPHKDVDLIGASLTRLGFTVTTLKDASYKAMDIALKRYVIEVRRAGRNALSFLYYSGHGVANPETQINYLIPIDVSDAEDDKVWFESLQQNTIIDVLSKQASNATHYVVFDACRNELNIAGAAAKALGTDKGFVPITDTAGLLIAYATAPRKTASDIGDDGGPYAKTLADELMKPGIEAITMFRNVQLRVKQTIGQDPWLSFPSLPAVYFAGQKTHEDEELEFWNSLKDKREPGALVAYLERYPGGAFSLLARAFMVQYEQKFRADEATREEERKHKTEVQKAAEVRRLEEVRQLREAALAQEHRSVAATNDVKHLRLLEEQQRRELAARTAELHIALKEARLAQEATVAAEKQRLAAADEATKAAERAVATTGTMSGDAVKVATLPRIEKPTIGGYLDGAWTIRWTSNCQGKTGSYPLSIQGGNISGRGGSWSGTVSPSGAARWSGGNPLGPAIYTGTFQGNVGSGKYHNQTTNCVGTFSAVRN